MTIYVIRPRIVEAGQPIHERLVKAASRVQARGHIVRGFIVAAATDDDIVSAFKRGAPIEEANGAAPATDPDPDDDGAPL